MIVRCRCPINTNTRKYYTASFWEPQVWSGLYPSSAKLTSLSPNYTSPLCPSSCLCSFLWTDACSCSKLIAPPKHIMSLLLAHMYAYSYFVFGSIYHFLGEEFFYSPFHTVVSFIHKLLSTVWNAEVTVSKWTFVSIRKMKVLKDTVSKRVPEVRSSLILVGNSGQLKYANRQ